MEPTLYEVTFKTQGDYSKTNEETALVAAHSVEEAMGKIRNAIHTTHTVTSIRVVWEGTRVIL